MLSSSPIAAGRLQHRPATPNHHGSFPTMMAARKLASRSIRWRYVATGLMSEYGNGGIAASWFSLIARAARPARRAGPIVRPPLFRPEWADEGGPSTGAELIGRTPT